MADAKPPVHIQVPGLPRFAMDSVWQASILGDVMRILLYNPDNGVTRNFMPHLWVFLLQALTPPEHEVLLVDGNAQPMDETQIAQFVRDQNIGLVGIGAIPGWSPGRIAWLTRDVIAADRLEEPFLRFLVAPVLAQGL